uniref:Centrosomal protein 131 n=1 Tax=Oryzias latipes TaxID=8090 RepID=A0A3P9I8Y8_ORYLA
MHTTKSPSSLPKASPGEALDLSLSGSQLSISKRPSSASPGKCFSRSISVSVAGDSRTKRNALGDANLGSSRSVKNLRRSNSTTQVNQQAMLTLSPGQTDDFSTLFESSSDGRRKLASLSRTERTTWNILDDQPRASTHNTGSMESPTSLKKKEPGVPLAASFTANNSNKGTVGNSVTTILHNNYSEKPLTPKSSNQKPSFNLLKATANDEVSLENSSVTKSQKNFSCSSSASNNRTSGPCSPASPRRRDATEEEAEFIQQVNQAAVTIQRWYRRHAKRKHSNKAALKLLLARKKKEKRVEDALQEQQRKLEERKQLREEKAQLARLAAIQELQQKRLQRSEAAQQATEVQLENLMQAGTVEGKKAASPALSNPRGFQCSQERAVSMEEQRRGPSRPPSKTTLNELLDTLKLLEEEEPQRLPGPKFHHNDKYAWIDEDADSNSLTTDNLERHGQMNHQTSLPDGGALLSEAKLQSIMSFLDEMETSEQERPRSITSGSQREALLSEDELLGAEQASAEVTGSMMRLKMELEEKRRSVSMLQTALAQQRELTARHVKETERELSRSFQLQKEQYEATIQRHLAFIDQLISDKKALSERCEGVVTELKQVDLKYTQKIAQMQQQHEMVWHILGPLCEEIKKLKDLMSASEKIRRERWIDEKTKKIKEITVKLEPEIQKLISKHKQELKKLRTLHEAELLQADERAAQRYVRQCEELRLQLEKEKEEQCQRERDLAKQYEKQLQEEELSLQQQRRRLYKEVSDDKERLSQLAAQRSELEDLRRQLEENSRLAERALREELEKSREEQEKRHQLEVKVLQERLDMEKQTWEESFKNKEEAWMLSREREMKAELRRERDKEIELAIWTLEEETSKDKAECERAADNVRRLREKYEAELRELESSERAAVEKQQELRRKQLEMEEQLVRLQTLFRQQEAEMEGQTRDKLAEERCSLTEVIRQEFAERLVAAEEENRRLKLEVSEVRARLRLEVDRIQQEKEEELAEVHQVKSAILKKEETVKNLRGQYEAALKRADHLEALWEQQRKQLLEK